MKKAYIQPEIELLKVSALNDFLIGSPDDKEGIDDAEAGDGWVNDNNGRKSVAEIKHLVGAFNNDTAYGK